MNRAQRRAVQKGKGKTTDITNPTQAQEMLKELPDATLVAGINHSLDILQKRGIVIRDWDNKKRELYRIKIFGYNTYFWAAEPNKKEGNERE